MAWHLVRAKRKERNQWTDDNSIFLRVHSLANAVLKNMAPQTHVDMHMCLHACMRWHMDAD